MKILIWFLLSVFSLHAQITSISDIKRTYANIHKHLNSYTKTHKIIQGISSEGAKATYFYNKKHKITLIQLQALGEMGKTDEEYYFSDGKLFFLYRVNSTYNAPIYVPQFNQKKTKITKERFYFIDNKLVKYLDNNLKPILKDTPQFKKENTQILNFTEHVLGIHPETKIRVIINEEEGFKTAILQKVQNSKILWSKTIAKAYPGVIDIAPILQIQNKIYIAYHTTIGGTGESNLTIKCLTADRKTAWKKSFEMFPQDNILSFEKLPNGNLSLTATKDLSDNNTSNIIISPNGKVLSL